VSELRRQISDEQIEQVIVRTLEATPPSETRWSSGGMARATGLGRTTIQQIALTGYAGDAIRDACLAPGFDIHLVRPGEIDLLEELLGAERRVNG
jgi:CheY-like chemotaxis protein